MQASDVFARLGANWERLQLVFAKNLKLKAELLVFKWRQIKALRNPVKRAYDFDGSEGYLVASDTAEDRVLHECARAGEGSPAREWNVSDSPSVSTSGQVIWSVRDLLFSEGRERAAAVLRNVKILKEEK